MGNASIIATDQSLYGLRPCLLCKQCSETFNFGREFAGRCDSWRMIRTGREMAGCHRFDFSAELLGDDGLAGENPGENNVQSSGPQ